jgi:hypothetical protein
MLRVTGLASCLRVHRLIVAAFIPEQDGGVAPGMVAAGPGRGALRVFDAVGSGGVLRYLDSRPLHVR